MDIYLSATTATTGAIGAAVTTGNSQVLPAWAPDIEYIATTSIAGIDILTMSNVYGPTTTGGVCRLMRTKVRNYDSRRITLHRQIRTATKAGGEIYHTTKGDAVVGLTYRAVGELKR